MTHAGQIRSLLDAVARASGEQSAGVDGVARSVQGLDSLTQQNTALAEEAAAASEALRHQAQSLIASVARFRLPA